MKKNRAIMAVVVTVVALVIPAKGVGAKTTTYNTPEKAGALVAQIDQVSNRKPYVAGLKALGPVCTEGPAQLADMVANVTVIAKKRSGKSVKTATVLADLLTALKANPRRQNCLELLVALAVLY